MSVTIDTPDSIPLSKVRAFLDDLGVPSKHLRELVVGVNGVYAEVIALDAEGRPYAIGDELAVHQIAIPLDRNA